MFYLINSMDDIIDISERDFGDSSIKFDNKSSSKGINFGSGIELLMNDKVKDVTGKNTNNNIGLEDLNDLENELNDLVEDIPYNNNAPRSGLFSGNVTFDDKPSVSFNDDVQSIGKATSQSAADTKTWDGYSKFNNIPINPDVHVSSTPQFSKEELLREKFKVLRKLEALEKKGVDLSKKYDMDSSLAEMQGEYETIMDEKSKQNSVKFQGNMLMAIINGIEFLNGKFDPFDIKLDGWNEQINENINDYDEIFGELHDKYKSKASMAPELKLLFQLGGSAMMVHMTNTMFKSAMPGMDDILRQNPDLMRSFQSAAVNSMSQTNPGFSGFMNNVMSQEPQYGSGPPPPMATQGPNSSPPQLQRPGNNNYAATSTRNMGTSNFTDDGISLRENLDKGNSQSKPRAEMKGPSDISHILSGLKTKTINIQQPQAVTNDNSTISISDLKELQNDGNMPKRSGRRKKSASNTVSLDI
jgi:hypothetical protein